MDKELARIHDLARDLIKKQFDQQVILQKAKDPSYSSSKHKKIRKVMTQIDQNFKIYADQVDNALVQGGDADSIRSIVRAVEEDALEAFRLLEDDSVHHKVQSRTGGDTLIEAPGDRVRRVFKRLEEKYDMTFGNSSGPKGNLSANYSLSNFAHKSDDRARGLERESGIGKNPDKTTTSHPKSTAGSSKNLTPAQLASDDALFEALDRNIGQQLSDSAGGLVTDAPRQQAIRDLTGDPLAYGETASKADVANTKKLIQTADPAKIARSYLELTSGVAKYGVRFGSLLPVLGVAFDGIDAKAKIETASKPDATGLDKFQAGLASTTLATSPIPEPTAQVINFGTGIANLTIDLGRDFINMLTNPKQPTEEDLDFSTL